MVNVPFRYRDRAHTYLLEFVEGSEVLRDPLATHHDGQFTPHDEKGPFLPLSDRPPAELIDPTDGALHPHAASVSTHSSGQVAVTTMTY